MAKITVYSTEDIKKIKQILKDANGEKSIRKIAEENYDKFNRPFTGFYLKLIELSNARSYGAKKAWRTRRGKIPTSSILQKQTFQKEIAMPEGFTFEGTPKKVTFCLDHFRVYF
jgi:hypothetical protein